MAGTLLALLIVWLILSALGLLRRPS